jgi:hypothetical protein
VTRPLHSNPPARWMWAHSVMRLAFLAMLAAATVVTTGCVPEGENSVNTRLVRPVVVSVAGEVVDATTRAPLEGIQILITRRAIGADAGTEVIDAGRLAGDGADADADADADTGAGVVTGANGRFTIPVLELDVERWEYGVLARDAQTPRVYRDAEAGGLYAFRDSDLELPTLLMVRVESQYRTSVQGTVKEAVRGGRPVADALVTLAIRETGEVPFSAKTDAAGGFRFDGVPAREYDLVISGSNARVNGEARAFAPVERVVQVRREDEVPTPGSGLVDLGVFFLVESAKNEDLRIVLTWDRDRPDDARPAVDLDAYLLLPDPSCDINHLGGAEVKLSSAAYSIAPSSGFGAGTCYWPAFLGGERGDPRRTLVGYSRKLHVVDHPGGDDQDLYSCRDAFEGGGADDPAVGTQCVVASLDNDSPDGSEPEVITLNRELMLGAYPTRLGYYYDYRINAAGDTVRHYPTGVAVYSVLQGIPDGVAPADAETANINLSGARVEVLQGNTRVASYDVTEIELAEDVRTWTVLMIEVGFRNPNPRTPEDVYFRVLPFNGLERAVEPQVFGWQDTRATEALDLTTEEIQTAPIGAVLAAADMDGTLIVSGEVEGATDETPDRYGLWVTAADQNGRSFLLRVTRDTEPTTALMAEGGTVYAARGDSGLVYPLGGPVFDDGTPVGADCTSTVHFLYASSAGIARTIFVGTESGLRRFDELRLQCPLAGADAGRFRDGECTGYACGDAENVAEGTCLPWEWKCDGVFDCPNGADESPETCENFQPAACQDGEFRCQNGQCVPGEWRCDRFADCERAEDEAGCGLDGCPDEAFTCGGVCLMRQHLCDGVIHCPNADDERNCSPDCPGGFGISCDDGTYCVSVEREACPDASPCGHVCDGVRDCRDGFDEDLCGSPPCTGLLCADGQCVPQENLCNGALDCATGEDEAFELCADGGLCDGVRCADDAATCVPWAQVCDGTAQCPFSEDEANCELPPCDGFECANRACIPREYACDQTVDCPDGEDEMNCQPCEGFRCNDNACIEVAQLCDGTRQCADGEDELQGCDQPCDGLRCFDGTCVPQAYLCDRTPDCPTVGDEPAADEAEAVCGRECPEFRCPTGECYAEAERCDGTVQCPDEADERECVAPCEGVRCPDGRCVAAEGECDQGSPDMGVGSPDMGVGSPDASTPDAAMPDAGTPDAAMPDAGMAPSPWRAPPFRRPFDEPPPASGEPNPTPPGTVLDITPYRDFNSQDLFMYVATAETGIWSRKVADPAAVWENRTLTGNSDALSGEGRRVKALANYNQFLWAAGDFGLALAYPDGDGVEQWLFQWCQPDQAARGECELDPTAGPDGTPDIVAMIVYQGRLFMGTTRGMWVLHFADVFDLRRLEHFPSDAIITGFRESGGRLYVLTANYGLFFVQVGGTRR